MVYKIYGVYTIVFILAMLYYKYIFIPSHSLEVIYNWINGKFFKLAVVLGFMLIIEVLFTAGILIFLIVTWNL